MELYYLPGSVDSVGGDTIILFIPSVISSTEEVREVVDSEISGCDTSWIGVIKQLEPPDVSRNIRIRIWPT